MKSHDKKSKTVKTPFVLRLLRLMYSKIGVLFPEYFGKLAYEQWFTTTRFKTPSYELTALHSATRETIDVNNLSIAVYIWRPKITPAKKTLLFVHGWTGRGTQIVNYIEKLNKLGYRVISFDGPAHGQSPGKQTSILEMTDVVLALNKQYGKFDAAISHSFGGMVILHAISLGLKIDRCALICPPKNFQIILDNFQRILNLPNNVMQVMTRKSFAIHGQVTRDAVDVIKNVKAITCEGLLIHDENDTEIPWQSSEEIAQAWPHANFIKTKDLGHRRIIHNDEVISHIIKFLN